MDIEISSNFERLLFDLHARDGARMAQRMAEFRSSKSLTLSAAQHADLKAIFSAHATDDAETIACIKRIYAECGVLLDPHTATGVAATEALRNSLSPCGRGLGRGGLPPAKSGGEPPPPNLPPQGGEGLIGPTVTLATAHPAKFPEAVKEATGISPALPSHLADLMTRAEKITPMGRDIEVLKSYITKL